MYPTVEQLQNEVLHSNENSSQVTNNHNNNNAIENELDERLENLAEFNDQDIEDFLNICKANVRTTRERRFQRKRCKTRSNTIAATLTRKEIFQSSPVDDDQFLNTLEDDNSYAAAQYRAKLINSIENIMKYFEEDVELRDEENSFKESPVNRNTKSRVAMAVASLRNKCGLNLTPLVKIKTSAQMMKSNKIQELKMKYESLNETEINDSNKKVPEKIITSDKVKQMALLFNNKINSSINDTASSSSPQTPESKTCSFRSFNSPTCISTLPSKTSKVKTKFLTYKTKLPSPKPSPFFKRKSLAKTASNRSLNDSPLMKRKQLQNQRSTTCLVAENVFSQLSVKDKILLFNKFIADISKQNPQFCKQVKLLEAEVIKNGVDDDDVGSGGVIIEKQNSVKSLKENLEAKMTPKIPLSKTLERFKNSNLLDISYKSKELSSNDLKEDFQDSLDSLHVSSLTVILKNSALENLNEKNQQRKKKDVKFRDEVSYIESSSKRTQEMMRTSCCPESFAPPKKIRCFRQERLAPKMFFQNAYLEKLFYNWLKEKNGKDFDIILANNENNIIKIVPKNSADKILPREEVQKILEAAIKRLELSQKQKIGNHDNTNNSLAIIKNVLENQNCLDKSVIEIELPLEGEEENEDFKIKQSEESDLGVTCLTKTTSEDSQTEIKSPDVNDCVNKSIRKKKSRRSFTTEKPKKISLTDSDSDNKTKNLKSQSFTLPKAKKCSNYIKRLFIRKQNKQTNNDVTISELDISLIRQVNSPNKIKSAYTLTVLSSPSPYPDSDTTDSELVTNYKSRSWPSLFETDLDKDVGILKCKSYSHELQDLAKTNLLQEQQKLLIDSFVDQGFQTGSTEIDSPVRIIKANHIKKDFPTPYKTARYVPAIRQEFAQERQNTPSSLAETASYSNFIPNPIQCSHFWISCGNFTTALSIYHCEAERLMLLSKRMAEKSLETKQIHLGIDDFQFCLNSSSSSFDISRLEPTIEKCSQYWFATGDMIMPFKGPQITMESVQKFFNYIQEFIDETNHIRFGIDGYEFSNIGQQIQICSTPLSGSPWTQINNSPLKTSDLDQTDERSRITFSSLSQYPNSCSPSNSDYNTNVPPFNLKELSNSLEQILLDATQMYISKTANDTTATIENDLTVEEILSVLQHPRNNLKCLEENVTNGISTLPSLETTTSNNCKESTENLSKLRTIINAIGLICRAMKSVNFISTGNIGNFC